MKTEIFGTFGPACREEDTIGKMIAAGMTGMRLNLSHTTLPEARDYITAYQRAASNAGVHPQILIDMQGPELRVGDLAEPLKLEVDEEVVLWNRAPVEMVRMPVCLDKPYEEVMSWDCESVENAPMPVCSDENCEEMVKKVSVGNTSMQKAIPIPSCVITATEENDELLLDDGKILLKIICVESEYIYAKTLRGGILRSHKSIKLVDKNVSLPPLTQHDIENIKHAKAFGVTALMQPFVRGKEDLLYVREVLKQYEAADVKIFAKIENRIGIEHLEEIISAADVIIIARGDLGNDMPLWELPRAQKQIEATCHKAGKPYIVVTQMLASMETNPLPTRAEVSDIFHAVYHGAWGVMLTGETAVGSYPVEAICYLANTAQEAGTYRSII